MSTKPKHMFIVKIQISQFTSDESIQMLIYTEERDLVYEAEATQDILEIMRDRPKAYFLADLAENPHDSEQLFLDIKSEVTEPQNW